MYRLIGDWMRGTEVMMSNHGHIRPDKTCIGQTRDWLTWLDGTLRAAVDSGLDMTDALDLPIPERFARLDVLRTEYRRSVAHPWPKIERDSLPHAD